MSKILVSAFEAFGGESVNPAEEALRHLDDPDVIGLILPVEYGRGAKILLDAVGANSPAAVVCLGQAGGRNAITPEKYAFNLRDSASPDSAGRLCRQEKIDPEGEQRLETTFGAEEIARALSEAGIPSRVSLSAGSYVCNDVLYSLLKALKGTDIPAGFIHLPYCAEQLAAHPGCFGMEISEMARGVRLALKDLRQRFELA